MLKNAYRNVKSEIKNPVNRRWITVIAAATVFEIGLVAYVRHDLKTK